MPWQQFFVLQELDWQIDQLRAELELAARLGDHNSAHLGSAITRARNESEAIEAQLSQREEQRSRTAALIAGPLLTHYDRLRTRLKTRPWVVRLSSTSCPACNLVLPSKLVSDAQRTSQPSPCPSCKRLLIWRRAEAVGTDC